MSPYSNEARLSLTSSSIAPQSLTKIKFEVTTDEDISIVTDCRLNSSGSDVIVFDIAANLLWNV